MLSNQQLKPLLSGENPIVKHVDLRLLDEGRKSPLQPASIDLHVGRILVPPERDLVGRLATLLRETLGRQHFDTHTRYSIPSGGSVVLVTQEEINFSGSYAGLMFPKSTGLAERGILLTNFGHVDPGYHGCLRYAVINLSSVDYPVSAGDAIACLCVFALTQDASPNWHEMRGGDIRSDAEAVRSLSPELLSLERTRQEARRITQETLAGFGLWASAIAVVVGVLSAAVTVGLVWTSFLIPKLDRYDAIMDQLMRRTPTTSEFAAPKDLKNKSHQDTRIPEKTKTN
jgi:deoxycytidine triphosphate deaminase